MRIEPPEGVEAIVVIPGDEVPTSEARAALPAEVPFADAVSNVAAASQLALGLERSDLGLIRRGLADRLHQPHRERLYPRSMELVRDATGHGRAGRDDLRRRADGARLELLAGHRRGRVGHRGASRRLGRGPARSPFSPVGADVPEL